MQTMRLQRSALLMSILLAAGCFLSIQNQAAFAQTAVTGALSGVVADASGAVVPNATVTITNTGTGATQTVNTNAEGRYTMSNLAPGAYTISASGNNLQSQT